MQGKPPTYQEMHDFWGSASKTMEMLCQAALTNDKPEVPWDWDLAIMQFYTPTYGLTWAIIRLTDLLKHDQSAISRPY